MIGDWNNGTGRRKSSVARVFLKKGSGKITVNGRTSEFFGRQDLDHDRKAALVLTNHTETFDIMVNVHGGGEVRSGRRHPPWRHPRPDRLRRIAQA